MASLRRISGPCVVREWLSTLAVWMHTTSEEEAQHLDIWKAHWLAEEQADAERQMRPEREQEECQQCWAHEEERREQKEEARAASDSAAATDAGGGPAGGIQGRLPLGCAAGVLRPHPPQL